MKKENITELDKEGLKFLERDFNQSFQQMRFYDSQIFDLLKFIFTAYISITGISIGLYQFSLKENFDLKSPILIVLFIALIIGEFFYALLIRNRVYFVILARYINEQRKLFLDLKPLGFKNLSKVYTNFSQPPYFNWRSSQAFMIYLIDFLNSFLLLIFMFIYKGSLCLKDIIIYIIIFIAFFIINLIIAISYLISRENKSASKAVFGKE